LLLLSKLSESLGYKCAMSAAGNVHSTPQQKCLQLFLECLVSSWMSLTGSLTHQLRCSRQKFRAACRSHLTISWDQQNIVDAIYHTLVEQCE